MIWYDTEIYDVRYDTIWNWDGASVIIPYKRHLYISFLTNTIAAEASPLNEFFKYIVVSMPNTNNLFSRTNPMYTENYVQKCFWYFHSILISPS